MSNLDYKATIKPRNKYQRYFHDRPASDWNYTSFKRQFTSKHPDKVKKRYKRNLKLIRDYSSDVPDSVSYHIGKLLESIPEDSNPSEPKVTIQHGNYYHFNTVSYKRMLYSKKNNPLAIE
ncbi:hypothetical protein BD560DRAFT_158701 [Blakeslea trispora]|nr:hypothetical protein BD560DRAFT_158701 [Blakeslea trispora]